MREEQQVRACQALGDSFHVALRELRQGVRAHAPARIPAQLTKSAPLGGDSETRTLKGPGEATWASRRAALAKLERAAFRSIGHFQQVHAAAPLTRRTKRSSPDYLAPQTGFELWTCWLTADFSDISHR